MVPNIPHFLLFWKPPWHDVYRCILDLWAVCTKYLDPVFLWFPQTGSLRRADSTSRAVVCCVKAVVQVPWRADLPLLPTVSEVLRAVAAIWGEKGTTLGKDVLADISGNIRIGKFTYKASTVGMDPATWPWSFILKAEPQFCLPPESDWAAFPFIIWVACVEQDHQNLLSGPWRECSVGTQVPPRSIGDWKASENKQISLWLHRATVQVPSAQLLTDGQKGIVEAA